MRSNGCDGSYSSSEIITIVHRQINEMEMSNGTRALLLRFELMPRYGIKINIDDSEQLRL